MRHGETELNRLGQCQGWIDHPLNATGTAQAEAVADALGSRRIRRVVASPLQRAHMTARAIARLHGVEVETHPGLRELDHGSLEGVPFTELDDHVPGIREAWRTRPHTVSMPGGENLATLQARVVAAFDEITSHHLANGHDTEGGHHLVLVAHALAIATVVCHFKQEGLEHLPHYRLGHCGYWELEHVDERWVVREGVGLMDIQHNI